MLHINAFDQYQPRPSLLHRLDPRVKVAVAVLAILSNALLPNGAWAAFALMWGTVLAVNRLAQLDVRFLLARAFIALPFALAAVSVLFTVPGTPLFSLSLGSTTLAITEPGLIRFGSILLRSWISVQTAVILAATTPFPDLIHALRHLRVPGVLVAIISFMYRYLFVLSDEALRLMRAREARRARSLQRSGSRRSGGSLAWRARVAGHMAGQLFLRSYERSDRVYQAMLARGYQGQLLTVHPHEMEGRDWLVGGAAVLILLTIQWIGRVV